ncbi:MAG: hypothetical protein IKZ98_02650 [Clostridia bacterium]|nr:hypothetical protein [Clostridia bacterium]
MYRRYSQVGDGSMSLSQINRNRIRNIIILLLLAAVVALLVLSIPMLQGKSNSHKLYIQQIQKECKEAYADTATLSRTAGADSAQILARVRCNIHAMRVINNLNTAENGRPFVSDESLQGLLNNVDKFLSVLSTGMATGEQVTALQNSLSELQDTVNSLE